MIYDQDMTIDSLIYDANFATGEKQAQAQLQIWQQALETENVPCSIAPIYFARGKDELPHDFIIPAFNLRGLTYQTAQTIFAIAKKMNVGLFIFELARSEMGYTDQPPAVYASNILAAAIKTGWNQPIFIQADHFQVKLDDNKQIKTDEIVNLKQLIQKSINAGFYNIDIDGSPLIRHSDDQTQQQTDNAGYVAQIADFVRTNQPAGVTISLGGEIGEIGSAHNSTNEDVQAFMELFNQNFQGNPGLSKLAVQTGTSHGGVVDKDGNIVKAQVAFDNIKKMSQFCRENYGMGGVVQHGASTLSDDEFAKFPDSQAIEIHLATGLQNMIFDHPNFPPELLKEIYNWIDQELINEKKENQTDEQFHYKLRKKAWKEFKQQIFELPEKNTAPIMQTLAEKFEFYFHSFNLAETNKLVSQYIQPVKIEHKLEDYLTESKDSAENLAD